MTDVEQKAATEVILGVDTHLDVHVAVALDGLGRRLGSWPSRRPRHYPHASPRRAVDNRRRSPRTAPRRAPVRLHYLTDESSRLLTREECHGGRDVLREPDASNERPGSVAGLYLLC